MWLPQAIFVMHAAASSWIAVSLRSNEATSRSTTFRVLKPVDKQVVNVKSKRIKKLLHLSGVRIKGVSQIALILRHIYCTCSNRSHHLPLLFLLHFTCHGAQESLIFFCLGLLPIPFLPREGFSNTAAVNCRPYGKRMEGSTKLACLYVFCVLVAEDEEAAFFP